MKEQSRVLEARGVEPPGVREMVEDFEDQAHLNPRLRQNVGHISLSFSPEDAPKLTDERMTQIAREYMQKMGITDTQYLLVRHLDQPHPHCHLVYNRVGDHGQTISDRNIKLRNAKVCRELTEHPRFRVGDYKALPNMIGETVYTAAPKEVPAQMQELERTGREIKGTGYQCPLQVLRFYQPKAGRSVLEERTGVLRLEGRQGLQFLEVGSPLLSGAAAAYGPDVGTQGGSRELPGCFCRVIRRRAFLLRSGRWWRRWKPWRRISVARQCRVDSAAAARFAICSFTRDDATA